MRGNSQRRRKRNPVIVAGLLLGIASATAAAYAEPELRPWKERTMWDLDVDPHRFQSLRGRYVQVMYDMEGRQEIQSRSVVHIDLEPVVHSGPWDNSLPGPTRPFREPGLKVVWRVQNGVYTGFDMMITDSHLSLRERVMPAGLGGLRVGSVLEGVHTQIKAAVPDEGEEIPLARLELPEGAVNVLSLPYVLAAMELEPGDRFTLPGYAMIGGPTGEGTLWRGAFYVRARGRKVVKGRAVPVTEVLLVRMDASNGVTRDEINLSEPGRKLTRLLVSPEPPYLLGRTNLLVGDNGEYVFIREYLGLADWAPQPLPTSHYTPAEAWQMDRETGQFFLLTDEHTPHVVVPLDGLE